MGKKHFSEEQIAFALRQAESGTSVAEVIRKLGISEQTFYRWNKRFTGSSTRPTSLPPGWDTRRRSPPSTISCHASTTSRTWFGGTAPSLCRSRRRPWSRRRRATRIATLLRRELRLRRRPHPAARARMKRQNPRPPLGLPRVLRRLRRWSKRTKWRGQDSNLRPRGYEPRELPGCSTPRHVF